MLSGRWLGLKVRQRIVGRQDDVLTKFCSTLAWFQHDQTVMHILKPIVSKRYLLKRMTLEDREIQELRQRVSAWPCKCCSPRPGPELHT